MDQLTKVFNYGKSEVRTVVKGEEVWFVAKDVCEVFGDTHYRRSISRLDEDEKGVTPLSTPGGTQQITVVNESGLYSLLFSMQPQKKSTVSEQEYKNRVDGLKKFKRWVTHDVLPSIRKHGMYAKDELLDNPDLLIEVASKLKEERAARLALEAKAKENQPKVLFANAVEVSQSSVLIGELSKILKQNGIEIGQNRLFDWLREKGYLIRKKGESFNLPTQKSMDLGLFEIKKRVINNPDGSIRTTRTPKVTGKGQIYFVNKFLANEAS
ncbi:phage antirepressor protein [Halalkalibacter wakoensis JCM 9140]|uniref:Phage antirepressor protein n=1 Tax=Halalkalibacter wakoensis JCM 9140 TaxID=1236970 RepID=W4Q4T8_9BACI|nr:phage antirepressor KilAC domain-containing protein [Halalkalibacter wakoensis]GAE27002.1 phage antirepressor protein [Halalkalibacter wakoensis JCM 9140]